MLKMRSGGGYNTSYTNIKNDGICRIAKTDVYAVSLDFKCIDAGDNNAIKVSIKRIRDHEETAIATSIFEAIDKNVNGQTMAIAALEAEDVIAVYTESDNGGYYRISSDTTLTICPM